NFGIVPFTFVDKQDYACVAQGDMLELDVKSLKRKVRMKNTSKGVELNVELGLSDREKALLMAGGRLAAIKAKHT
ncbi:MAG: aconitate hydratase, partial [Candidatus Bathyarchaeia archaeon]